MNDPLYNKAKKYVIKTREARLSGLQRHLVIGYNRTARIMEDLEENKVVSKPNIKGIREVLESQ